MRRATKKKIQSRIICTLYIHYTYTEKEKIKKENYFPLKTCSTTIFIKRYSPRDSPCSTTNICLQRNFILFFSTRNETDSVGLTFLC